jgi:hypothetical protein
MWFAADVGGGSVWWTDGGCVASWKNQESARRKIGEPFC